jgi:putative ABC transport system substrate-binding protein
VNTTHARFALLIALGLVLGSPMSPVPLAAAGAKTVQVGVLSTYPTSDLPFFVALSRRFRELGYLEGQNLVLEFRNAGGDADRLPRLADDLVRLRVDAIVAVGTESTLRAASRATRTTPIVVIALDYDPVALGYATSLARPGGNVTGVFLRQPELTAKRLELLREAIPKLTRVAVLADAYSLDQIKLAEPAGPSLGLRLQVLDTRTPGGLSGAFEAAHPGRAAALLVPASPTFFRERRRIADLAVRYRLPTITAAREFADAGALMSYGANLSAMSARAADYVDRIVKGARPGDLPVEQPTTFELVVNLKTARVLGLAIPQPLLMRADALIR